MVSPHGNVTVEIVLARQVKQICIEFGGHLLAGTRFPSTSMRIVSQNLLDIQNPLVSCSDLGLNGAKVGANPVDDL